MEEEEPTLREMIDKLKPKDDFSQRPDWNEYFVNITKEIAKRSTCMSTKIGAIIVKDKRIISTGYNGAPRKTKDCCERGNCLRRELKIPSGQRYELCRSVHAEMNAMINATTAGVSLEGATMFIFGVKVYGGQNKVVKAYPCFICKKMIINAGIKYVVGLDENQEIKSYDVDEWIKEWQEKDIIDDKDNYDSKYYEEKKE